jgi:imidazolonepropionase
MRDGLLFTPALFTGAVPSPVRGDALTALEVVHDGALAWRDGSVVYAGPSSGLPEQLRRLLEGQARHVPGAVLPGFVDCHTHLPFFGWRADEFEARLAGRTYRDLHGSGGGIARSARLLAEASDEEVMEFCAPLATEMLAHGTTAVELKTGYGLSVEAELRQARLARRLGSEMAQTATVTLLACHAVPSGVDREAWVDRACRELIPAAASEGLADAVDIYVEDIAFGVDDLRRVAEAAAERGLALRCHADQLGPSGAAEVAVEAGALNADHLNHVSAEGVAALGSGQTVAVLVPVADLFTRERPPPLAELLDAGAAVAVATDFNPGTSPCLSIPEAMSVAASLYRMSPAAALAATTINAAAALGLQDRLGSLEPGKQADFVVLDGLDLELVPYRPGHNPVVETWIGGERLSSARLASPSRLLE